MRLVDPCLTDIQTLQWSHLPYIKRLFHPTKNLTFLKQSLNHENDVKYKCQMTHGNFITQGICTQGMQHPGPLPSDIYSFRTTVDAAAVVALFNFRRRWHNKNIIFFAQKIEAVISWNLPLRIYRRHSIIIVILTNCIWALR